MAILKDMAASVCKSYKIKRLTWNNSPCSIVLESGGTEFPLLGLVNLLALRGTLSFPTDATSISPTKLTVLLAGALLSSGPCSFKTLDLIVDFLKKEIRQVLFDVKFGCVEEFTPSLETELVSLFKVPLYHGWVIDPSLAAVRAIIGDSSYEEIKTYSEKGAGSVDPTLPWVKATEMVLQMATDGMTRYGLEELEKKVKNCELGVLWRVNKLVAVYKVGGVLYQLVTEEDEANEDLGKAVWKTLSVEDQSVFVDKNFDDIRGRGQRIQDGYVESSKEGNKVENEQLSHNYRENVIENIKKLLVRHPKGMDRSMFTKQYFKTYGEELDIERLGYTDIVQFFLSLGENYLKISCLPDGETQVSNMTIIPSKALLNQLANQETIKSSNKILVSEQQETQKSSGKTPGDQTKKQQETQKSPHKTLRNQQEAQKSETKTKTPVDQKKKQLEVQKSFSKIIMKQKKSQKSLSKTLVDQEDKRKAQKSTSDLGAISKHFVFNIEEEFLQPTDDCGVRFKVNLPDGLEEGDSLDVLVCDVTSPSDFWIQLRRAENSLRLEELMREMDRFYSDEEFGRLSKLDQCSFGAIMAAPYKEYGYHRVYIRKVLEDDVEVLFLDYVTTGFLQISQIRLLHKKFSELPAQALKAKLWRLTSLPGLSWSPQSIKRFFALVCPATNTGGCVSVVKEVRDGVLHLELYDTVTNDIPEGINISQQLIKEGMAVKEDGRSQSELRKSEKTGHGNRNVMPRPSLTGGEKLDAQDFEPIEKTKDDGDEEKNGLSSHCKTIDISLLNLPNTVLHIINYKGQAWMTSFQISSLILNWKGLDLLDKMIELKRIPLEVEVVTAECDLYNTLRGIGMIPLKDRRTGEDKFLLYLVKCVPRLLKTFIKDNQETYVAIQTALMQFY